MYIVKVSGKGEMLNMKTKEFVKLVEGLDRDITVVETPQRVTVYKKISPFGDTVNANTTLAYVSSTLPGVVCTTDKFWETLNDAQINRLSRYLLRYANIHPSKREPVQVFQAYLGDFYLVKYTNVPDSIAWLRDGDYLDAEHTDYFTMEELEVVLEGVDIETAITSGILQLEDRTDEVVAISR